MTSVDQETITESALRKRWTCESTAPWATSAIRRLVMRAERPPLALTVNDQAAVERELLETIDAVNEVLSRTYNISVVICAAWKQEEDVLATTQSVRLLDPKPDCSLVTDCFSNLFARCSLDNSTMHRTLTPRNAYPVVWPDCLKGGRLSAPPAHPNLQQENRNWKSFLDHLWCWQGGKGNVDWETLVDNVQKGYFQYIDRKRMPDDLRGFVHIDNWSDEFTLRWSENARKHFDEWGRVNVAHGDQALHFTRVDGGPYRGTIFNERLSYQPHPEAEFEWDLPSMLFEKRMRRAIESTEGSVAAGLYDMAQLMVEELSKHVRGIDHLFTELREYKSATPKPPVTAYSSEARSTETTWHPAAAHLFRELAYFDWNTDRRKYRYPEAFRSRLESGHALWQSSALYDWFSTHPFLDATENVLLGGLNGAIVGFYTILQYGHNMLEVTPNSQLEEDQLEESCRAFYGRGDMRVLKKCVETMLSDVRTGRLNLGKSHPGAVNLPSLPCDFKTRYMRWEPSHWTDRLPDGLSRELLASDIACTMRNMFQSVPSSRLPLREAYVIADDFSKTEELYAQKHMQKLKSIVCDSSSDHCHTSMMQDLLQGDRDISTINRLRVTGPITDFMDTPQEEYHMDKFFNFSEA
ncbi:hypothetical protein RhiJN_28987 [Ceratobasidium sp. AG-Ba]|nr:hypothetical protein RhiJN_28987 [Ceratobasidium sp. AG-Ba]